MLVTSLPYLLGFQNQGSEWRFTGFLFGAEDGNSYIAKMLLGAWGDWLFRTPYTAYPQSGFLAFLPYLLLGKLSAPPGEHEQLVAFFQVFRVASGVLFIWATYDFLALFLREVWARRLGTALAALGGGLGWLTLVGLQGLWRGRLPGLDMPLEFYSPETFGFLMLYGLPHLAAARAFLLWGLRDYLSESSKEPRSLTERQLRVRGGLFWLLLGLMQPLTVVVGWFVVGLHLAVTGFWQMTRRSTQIPDWPRWRLYFARALWLGLISAPFVLYNVLAFQLDPFLRNWQTQNKIISPYFSHYLLAYALLLPLALVGVPAVLRRMPWRGWLVTAWFVAFPFLAYAPYNLQRRLPEGVWVAIIVLALYWLEGASPLVRRWAPRYLSLAFLSSLVLLVGGLFAVLTPATPLYQPTAEIRAFLFLAGQARSEDVVLASYNTSNPLPAWAPVHTLTGHGPESMHLDQIAPRVACVYQSTCSDASRLAFLRTFDVRYLFWGPEERKLGDWNPSGAAFLEPIYQQDGYAIYQVKAEARVK